MPPREEIELEVDFSTIHIAQADSARVVESLMSSPNVFKNAEGNRIVTSEEIHLGNTAIGQCRPELQSVAFTVFLRELETLNGLVETVHFRQDVCPIQTDRRQDQVMFGVLESLLSTIVMDKRFRIAIEPVIDVSQSNFKGG
jgi:hypothetical protein